MAASFLSPAKKSKREAELGRMRERWSRRPLKTKPPDGRKRRAAKGKPSWSARQRAKFKNASRPRPWARSALTEIIAGLKNGDTVWLERDSRSVHGAARTAKRKVVTRTAFKKGVKGVRVTAIRAKKKKKSVLLPNRV